MAGIDVAGGASTFFTYFNPTRSPYYTVGVAACVALFFTCDVDPVYLWRWLAIPSFVVAGLAFVLSLDAKNLLSKADHAEQLRFARSTSISAAVLSLAFADRAIYQAASNGKLDQIQMRHFWIVVAACCLQVGLFLLYNWALNKQDPSLEDHNYVQITLLTSAFLVDLCCNLAAATGTDNVSRHHEVTAYVLGTYWLICVYFWVYKLTKLGISVDVRRPAASAAPAPQNAAP
jgi:hypothetical protein